MTNRTITPRPLFVSKSCRVAHGVILWSKHLVAAGVIACALWPAVMLQADERETRIARHCYRFTYLCSEIRETTLPDHWSRVLYVAARVRYAGRTRPLGAVTVGVLLRLDNRERIRTRAHVSVNGIRAGQVGIVVFPVKLPDKLRKENGPRVERVSITIDANVLAAEREKHYVEFGAPPSPGLKLAKVDMEKPYAKLAYLSGFEFRTSRFRTKRLIRPLLVLWSEPGQPDAEIVCRAKHGRAVRVLGEDDGWKKVRTLLGETGWVPEWQLVPRRPSWPKKRKVRSSGYTFQILDYQVSPSAGGGVTVEGRLRNNSGKTYRFTGYELQYLNHRGRRIGRGRIEFTGLGRGEVASFLEITGDVHSFDVARVKFRIRDIVEEPPYPAGTWTAQP